MATVGVAAVAALEMIGRGEDQIRTFIVEVFRTEFVATWLYFLFCSGLFVEFDWLRHGSGFCDTAPFPFYSFPIYRAAGEVPPLPGDKPFLLKSLGGVMVCKYEIIKGFNAKYVQINELAPEGANILRACSFFRSIYPV